MKIELRKLADVRPYANNPRINDDAVAAVAASIKEFGFQQPIVVDQDGVVVCGHTRLKAAAKLGLQKVPVHVARDLTPAQIKAFRIADNQTASLAEWNLDLLPLELVDLQGMDFDLGILGFDPDELAKLLDPSLCDQPGENDRERQKVQQHHHQQMDLARPPAKSLVDFDSDRRPKGSVSHNSRSVFACFLGFAGQGIRVRNGFTSVTNSSQTCAAPSSVRTAISKSPKPDHDASGRCLWFRHQRPQIASELQSASAYSLFGPFFGVVRSHEREVKSPRGLKPLTEAAERRATMQAVVATANPLDSGRPTIVESRE